MPKSKYPLLIVQSKDSDLASQMRLIERLHNLAVEVHDRCEESNSVFGAAFADDVLQTCSRWAHRLSCEDNRREMLRSGQQRELFV